MKKASISLIIPTKNSKKLLQRNIKDLVEISNYVTETIVVDSSSNEETLAYLKQNLSESSTQYFSLPPGLYKAWNAGINKAKENHTYIATSGDRIDLENFKRLYHTAITFDADITISAPFFFNEDGNFLDRKWPIHLYLEYSRCKIPKIIPTSHVSCFNILQFPKTLMGSSASNIYKTSFFKKNPFPVDFGGQGDSVWGSMHCLDAKWAVNPECSSDFVVHESTHSDCKSEKNFKIRQFDTIKKYLSEKSSENNIETKKALNYLELAYKRIIMRNELNLKREKPVWYLKPNIWKLRSRYKNNIKLMQELLKSVSNQAL